MVPLICVLWVGLDFHAAQSVPLEKGEHMGHIFTCCLVWQGCSSASENWVRTGWELGGGVREREIKLLEFNRTLLSFCITVTTSTWAFKPFLFFLLSGLHVLFCKYIYFLKWLFYYWHKLCSWNTKSYVQQTCKHCCGADELSPVSHLLYNSSRTTHKIEEVWRK